MKLLVSKTPNQGLGSSFCCWTARQGLAQKECLCHRHRYKRQESLQRYCGLTFQRSSKRRSVLFVGSVFISQTLYVYIIQSQMIHYTICVICFNIHIYIYIYIHTYIHIYTHTYIQLCIYIYIHICIQTYIYIYIHTYIYI